MIGNDLVDLLAREAAGKSRDTRFVDRVFTAREAQLVARATDPDHALWMLWAAKEAAYKVARKLRDDAIFAHSRYEVTVDGGVLPDRVTTRSLTLRGEVRLHRIAGLADVRLPLEWRLSRALVHCIALDSESDFGSLRVAISELDAPAEPSRAYDPTERELASLTRRRSGESLAVRRLAHSLAVEAGLGEVEVVRERNESGFGPPLLFPRGGTDPLAGWDVTLSHDGAWVAAVLGPTGSGT